MSTITINTLKELVKHPNHRSFQLDGVKTEFFEDQKYLGAKGKRRKNALLCLLHALNNSISSDTVFDVEDFQALTVGGKRYMNEFTVSHLEMVLMANETYDTKCLNSKINVDHKVLRELDVVRRLHLLLQEDKFVGLVMHEGSHDHGHFVAAARCADGFYYRDSMNSPQDLWDFRKMERYLIQNVLGCGENANRSESHNVFAIFEKLTRREKKNNRKSL